MGLVQAPEGLQAITVDGEPYFVDQAAIADLQKKGIPYDDGHNAFKSSTLSDAARGAVHGATLGFADKKFGDSNQSVMQRYGGDDYDEVKERSPIATGVGDFAGSVALPVPGSGARAGATGWKAAAALLARRTAEQAAVGGTMGGARAIAEGEDPTQAAEIGAALGGAGSAALGLGGAAVNAAKPYVEKGLNAVADVARTRGAFGITGGTDKTALAIAQRFGVDELPSRLADAIEALVPPKGVKGRTPLEYTKELEPIIANKGAEIGQLRQEMGTNQGLDALIPGEWSQMRQNLQGQLDKTSIRTKEGEELASALRRNIGALDAPTPELAAKFEQLKSNLASADTPKAQAAAQRKLDAYYKSIEPKTISDLADIKSEYQAAGHKGPLGSVQDNAAAEAAANVGKEGKDTLNRLLALATDESRNAHDLAQQEYGVASMLKKQIDPKALKDQFATNISGLGSVLGGTASGAIVGGLSGLAAGSAADHPKAGALAGMLAGAGTGFNMAAGSGTRNLMTQLLARPQAMDTIANITRASGKKLSQIDLDKLTRYVQSLTGKVGGYVADQ